MLLLGMQRIYKTAYGLLEMQKHIITVSPDECIQSDQPYAANITAVCDCDCVGLTPGSSSHSSPASLGMTAYSARLKASSLRSADRMKRAYTPRKSSSF